ncbi:MAG: hypothetical protein J5985_03235 [Kiritimatiellae bacterium]|nr:hypothetical protein [Kiritimatiellia bacterium]
MIHHIGRRCREWDYSGRAIYMITISLRTRGKPVLADWPSIQSSGDVLRSAGNGGVISMPLTALGEKVLACWRRIPEFWPMVELLAYQVMPDHFHGLLFVKDTLIRKTLGDVIRGFKTGCREVGWEEGYVDNILFREGQLRRMADYILDNPRRLAEKRANPSLFRRVLDLEVSLPVSGGAHNQKPCAPAETPEFITAHFSAIGNTALLRWPVALQVQCSRADFRYRRERLANGGWKILRDSSDVPLVEYTSPAFEEKCEDTLRCAQNGAVLISPCISHGEREITRRAHLAGARIIALRNKGFAKFEKPNGALFDQCAKGNLLLLAPAAWPYIPGEKPPTRETSLVLNRIAQLLAGEGAADIDYHGVVFKDIDAKVFAAVRSVT